MKTIELYDGSASFSGYQTLLTAIEENFLMSNGLGNIGLRKYTASEVKTT